jgi:hypothetical protein
MDIELLISLQIEQTKSRAEKIFEAKERNEQKLLERLRYR